MKALLDAHPSERDAMMAVLQASYGNAYAAKLIAEPVAVAAHVDNPAFVSGLAALAPDDQAALAAAIDTAIGNAEMYSVPRDFALGHLQHLLAVNLARGTSAAELVSLIGTMGFAQSVSNAHAFDTAAATARDRAASAATTPTTAAPIVVQDVAADFTAAVALTPLDDQQRIDEAMATALANVGHYAHVPEAYARDYLQRVVSVGLQRGTDLGELLQTITTMGFAQAISSGYDRAYYEEKERTDPEFARQQQQMRAGNAAQTRALADEMHAAEVAAAETTAAAPEVEAEVIAAPEPEVFAAPTPLVAPPVEHVAADYEAALAALNIGDQQRLREAVDLACALASRYQNMMDSYALDYAQRVVIACLARGCSVDDLAAAIGNAGFAQGIASGYDRAYYEGLERADPEFARQQREMRDRNQAQTRIIADVLASV